MFVHLTLEQRVASIRRSGINRLRKNAHAEPGVFATPVTRNFYVSHQWLRELKRRSGGSIAGVYFRIPDEQPVWVAHYGQAHQRMSAAEAVAVFLNAEAVDGFQVVIPRRIAAKEIHRVRSLPQVVGWRFYPGSHGRKPCGCSFCLRGEYGAGKLRDEFERDS